MAKAIKIRAKSRKGVVTVKALMTHPMETGLRKNKKTGKKIPAHHITEVKATANGSEVLTADWSGGISKNPYLSFKFDGEKGGKIAISWADNMGNNASVESKIK